MLYSAALQPLIGRVYANLDSKVSNDVHPYAVY